MTSFADIASYSFKDLTDIISSKKNDALLIKEADRVRRIHYGNAVYIRGLIEVSNYCKNNCLYCGIRALNKNARRYRLTKDEILSCCDEGYALGFRTFVMQGGEDAHFTDERVCDIIYSVKNKYPDSAITLSLGERSKKSYKAMYDAGADRYLLRHESANNAHYAMLHPSNLSLDTRKKCLFDLRDIGYQVGSGFMVGSPHQTYGNLAEDLLFLKELNPHMIGIGPFIPHKDTVFAKELPGSLALTLRMLSILRLMFPKALIPSTTALSSIAPDGREKGIRAGANVIMPNLSPETVRDKYSLYDSKAHSGCEAAENLARLKKSMADIGYEIITDRGDSKVN